MNDESEDNGLLVCSVCGKEIELSDYESMMKNIRMDGKILKLFGMFKKLN